jgi:hypothetical protein
MPITGAEKDKVAKKTCIYILMTSVTLYTLSYCLNIFFIASPTTSQLILSAILIFTVVIFFVDVFQTLKIKYKFYQWSNKALLHFFNSLLLYYQQLNVYKSSLYLVSVNCNFPITALRRCRIHLFDF